MVKKGEILGSITDSSDPRRKAIVSHEIPMKDVNTLLIENFVGLQKAMTHLSMKFENLTEQISKLLQVFELSARNISEKGLNTNNNEISIKLSELLEQNKAIAAGIIFLEDKINKDSKQFTPPHQPQPQRAPFPNDRFRSKPLPRI